MTTEASRRAKNTAENDRRRYAREGLNKRLASSSASANVEVRGNDMWDVPMR